MGNQIYFDPDPEETRDWIESIEGVIKHEGAEKADFLLGQLTDTARNNGFPPHRV